MIRKYTIRGVRYTIRPARIKDRGTCDNPKSEKPTIKYNKGLAGAELLEVLIHEVMHACLWDLDEHAIEESSIIISKVISDYFELEAKR
jgi:hypothetical protein